jgi:hypothetical protein
MWSLADMLPLVFMRLDLRQQSEHVLVLGVPHRARLVPGLVSGWLLYALTGGSWPPADGSAVALGLLVLTVAATLYEDRWTFDRKLGSVVRRVGLLPAAKSTGYRFEDLQSLYLSGSLLQRKDGLSPASYVAIGVASKDGRDHRIEQYRGSRAGQLVKTAQRIGAFTGLPVDDRLRRTGGG